MPPRLQVEPNTFQYSFASLNKLSFPYYTLSTYFDSGTRLGEPGKSAPQPPMHSHMYIAQRKTHSNLTKESHLTHVDTPGCLQAIEASPPDHWG